MRVINDLAIATVPRGTTKHKVHSTLLCSESEDGLVLDCVSLPEGKWKIICAFSEMGVSHFNAAKKAARGEITIPDELKAYMSYTSEIVFLKRVAK